MKRKHQPNQHTYKSRHTTGKSRGVSSPLTNQPSTLQLQQALQDPHKASPEAILQLQRLYGNRAVTGLIQQAVVQRTYLDNYHHWMTRTTVPKATIRGREIGKGKRGRHLRAIDTALRNYGSAGELRPKQLGDLKNAINAWKGDKAGKSSQRRPRILELEQEVDSKINFFRLGGIVYRNPPLSEDEGRNILVQIEQGNSNALNGLSGDKPTYGTFEDFASPREHEWGLAKDREIDEVFLIVGDATGVTWGPYLQYVTALAHSHPYFKDPHEPMGRTRFGGVGTHTKEIATHDPLPHGIVLWSDLAPQREYNEMLKIFPSASDVSFTTNQGLDRHTVYTPYAYADNPKRIGNPDSEIGNGPRLSFEILNARQEGGSGKIFLCTLVAKAGDGEFWRQNDVRADTSAGQLGTLSW